MSTETRDKKIGIYNENFRRFALADDGRTIVLTGKKHSRIAIAGNKNKVRVFGTLTHQNTAVSGKDVKIYVKATAANTAVSGENLAVEIANEYSQTAVVGREGTVDIRSVCCRTAVGVYEAEINIVGDHNETAICDCQSVNIEGKHNNIAVVGCNPTIRCTGTDNHIICFGPYTTFSGTAGNCITVAAYDDNRRVSGFVTGWIGENGLTENVSYRVRKGQFVEVTP